MRLLSPTFALSIASVISLVGPQIAFGENEERQRISFPQKALLAGKSIIGKGKQSIAGRGEFDTHFQFTYAGAITNLTPGIEASVWLPIASDSNDQVIQRRRIQLPAEFKIHREEVFGNQMVHFIGTANEAGEIPFEISYRFRRKALSAKSVNPVSQASRELFLNGSSFVPIDRNLSKQVLGENNVSSDAMIAGRKIYDAVNQRMRYDKPEGQSWGKEIVCGRVIMDLVIAPTSTASLFPSVENSKFQRNLRLASPFNSMKNRVRLVATTAGRNLPLLIDGFR